MHSLAVPFTNQSCFIIIIQTWTFHYLYLMAISAEIGDHRSATLEKICKWWGTSISISEYEYDPLYVSNYIGT